MSGSLEEHLAAYEAAVRAATAPGGGAAALYDAARVRDRVASQLWRGGSPPALDLARQLLAADAALRRSAGALAGSIPSDVLRGWRVSLQPAAGAWWWDLEQVAAERESPLWAIAAGLAVTLSLAFFSIAVARFFEGGPDLWGAVAVMLQGVLTVLAGTAVAEAGAGWIHPILERMGARRAARGRWKLGLALLVLAGAVALRLSLPAIAVVYNDHGYERQRQGDLSGAIGSYQRAIILDPDATPARYNLAGAYEDTGDYDKAIATYQGALRGDASMPEAYNDLARLLILHRRAFAGALTLLATGERLRPAAPSTRYSLAKNKGWANLGLQNLVAAEFDLEGAIRMDSRRAAAHCLLAQVYEAEGKALAAGGEWLACASGDPAGTEAAWLERASERVAAAGASGKGRP